MALRIIWGSFGTAWPPSVVIRTAWRFFPGKNSIYSRKNGVLMINFEPNVIQPMSWVKLEAEFSLQEFEGQHWICVPRPFIPEGKKYVARDRGPELLEEVCGFLGAFAVGRPFNIRDPKTWEQLSPEEIISSALRFTQEFGLLRDLNGEKRTRQNPQGVVDFGEFLGIYKVQDWADSLYELRAALRLVKLLCRVLKSPGRKTARLLDKELAARFQLIESRGYPEVRFLYERPQLGQNLEQASNFWETELLFHGRFRGSRDNPNVLVWAQSRELETLARFAVAFMAERKLNGEISLSFAPTLSPSSEHTGFFPSFRANSLEGELWLTLSESLTSMKSLGICENPECGKLYQRVRTGKGKTSQRHCSDECYERNRYLRKKETARAKKT